MDVKYIFSFKCIEYFTKKLAVTTSKFPFLLSDLVTIWTLQRLYLNCYLT